MVCHAIRDVPATKEKQKLGKFESTGDKKKEADWSGEGDQHDKRKKKAPAVWTPSPAPPRKKNLEEG